MTFYYVPDVARALLSVESLSFRGCEWLGHKVHAQVDCEPDGHVHGASTYSGSTITGGFKKPRELTWLTGIVLAVLTVSFGVTGYSLPFTIRLVTGPFVLSPEYLMPYLSSDLS